MKPCADAFYGSVFNEMKIRNLSLLRLKYADDSSCGIILLLLAKMYLCLQKVKIIESKHRPKCIVIKEKTIPAQLIWNY